LSDFIGGKRSLVRRDRWTSRSLLDRCVDRRPTAYLRKVACAKKTGGAHGSAGVLVKPQ
jgi:hypothetical protein